jgi:peptidyl-prolyl cis-trans isomerase C
MKLIRLLGACAVVALGACSKPAAIDKPATPVTPAKPPVVTVNGKAISPELFDDYVKAVTRGNPADVSPADREQIKENLVRMELIAQQAEKDGLDKDPETASRIALTRLNVLQQASAAAYLKDIKPTDAELRAEFDTQIASTPLVEYQARHILVSSEDIAQKVIEQLKGGADFATLAKRLSKDTQSAKNGGDLGWFSPDGMVKPFADAVALLKKGETTKTPVQTQFGWHVIMVDDVRDAKVPAYEEVTPQLQQRMQAQWLDKYFKDLRAKNGM